MPVFHTALEASRWLKTRTSVLTHIVNKVLVFRWVGTVTHTPADIELPATFSLYHLLWYTPTVGSWLSQTLRRWISLCSPVKMGSIHACKVPIHHCQSNCVVWPNPKNLGDEPLTPVKGVIFLLWLSKKSYCTSRATNGPRSRWSKASVCCHYL